MTSIVGTGARAGQDEHFLRFYQEDSHLYNSVGPFLRDGLEGGEGVVVIATPEHRKGFERAFREAGLDVTGAKERGDLTILDAEERLSSFLIGDLARGVLDPEAFEPARPGSDDAAVAGPRPEGAAGGTGEEEIRRCSRAALIPPRSGEKRRPPR